MIILAHVYPAGIIFQLRNFDVPLMVILSGASFGLVYKREPYVQYVWKRIKRLVLPVWIFSTFYFLSLYILRPIDKELNFDTIMGTYLLIGGIGYVWIIRVFIFVALVAPLIQRINLNFKINKFYFLTLLSLFLVYEITRYFLMPHIDHGYWKAVYLIAFYMLPYTLMFAVGLRVMQLTGHATKRLFWLNLLGLLSIVAIMWLKYGGFISLQDYKHPPSIYYCLYGGTISLFLWLVSDTIWRIIAKNKTIVSIILFVAQNSIWIYLWHIIFIKAISAHYLLKYLLVMTGASVMVFCQVWIVKNLMLTRFRSERIKKNIKMIFTG